MTARRLVGLVTFAAVLLLAAAILIQGDVLAPSPAGASDAQLIAAARDTDEAREFERNNAAAPVATVDRSGRVAVDLRSGPGHGSGCSSTAACASKHSCSNVHGDRSSRRT